MNWVNPIPDCVLKIHLTMLLTKIKSVGEILVFDCPVYSNIQEAAIRNPHMSCIPLISSIDSLPKEKIKTGNSPTIMLAFKAL